MGVGCVSDSCLTCDPCLAGEEHTCDQGMTMTYSSQIKHGHIATDSGYTYGGYSASQTVNQHFLVKIPSSFPLEAAGVGMRLTTAKFFSPKGLPYSTVGVEPDVPVQTVARPVDGTVAAGSNDTTLAAAVDVARRLTPRPAARPTGRSTASR